jgi:hypothetical protein
MIQLGQIQQNFDVLLSNEIRAVISVSPYGTGNIARLSSTFPEGPRAVIDKDTEMLDIFSFLETYRREKVVIIDGVDKASPEVIALLKGAIDGAIMYNTLQVHRKFDFKAAVVMAATDIENVDKALIRRSLVCMPR